MSKNIKLTTTQRDFISQAVSMNHFIIDFESEVEGQSFEDVHGCTKEEMKKEIQDLGNKLG